MSGRPGMIRHWREVQWPDDEHYPGSNERVSIRSSFGHVFGLQRVAVNLDVLPPGRRSSWPHAHSAEEECVFVVEGNPDVWIDGELYRLQPGDAVGFPAGTGIAHTFINNTTADVLLLVVGERGRSGDRVHYPLHPRRNAEIGTAHWQDAPARPRGGHDGRPDALRASPADPH
jgi:uncharacterized cupin superfamily protein